MMLISNSTLLTYVVFFFESMYNRYIYYALSSRHVINKSSRLPELPIFTQVRYLDKSVIPEYVLS